MSVELASLDTQEDEPLVSSSRQRPSLDDQDGVRGHHRVLESGDIEENFEKSETQPSSFPEGSYYRRDLLPRAGEDVESGVASKRQEKKPRKVKSVRWSDEEGQDLVSAVYAVDHPSLYDRRPWRPDIEIFQNNHWPICLLCSLLLGLLAVVVLTALHIYGYL